MGFDTLIVNGRVATATDTYASDIAIRPVLNQVFVTAIFGAFARRKQIGIMTADGGA